MNKTERGVALNLAKMDRTDRDELVVRTIGTTGRMSLSIKSPTDFSIAIGDQPVATGKGFRNMLDPTAKEYTEPPAAASDPTAEVGLRFRVWYVPQTGTPDCRATRRPSRPIGPGVETWITSNAERAA